MKDKGGEGEGACGPTLFVHCKMLFGLWCLQLNLFVCKGVRP